MNFALNGVSLSASAYMPDRFMFTSKRSFMLHDWYECRHNFSKGHGSVTCIVLKTDICGFIGKLHLQKESAIFLVQQLVLAATLLNINIIIHVSSILWHLKGLFLLFSIHFFSCNNSGCSIKFPFFIVRLKFLSL